MQKEEHASDVAARIDMTPRVEFKEFGLQRMQSMKKVRKKSQRTMELQVATMNVDEDDYTDYTTEDEPEPHELDSELEGGGANEFRLQDQAWRMHRVLEWRRNLLDVAQIDEVERIEGDIDHIDDALTTALTATMEVPQRWLWLML